LWRCRRFADAGRITNWSGLGHAERGGIRDRGTDRHREQRGVAD
jgi:hypothetical protein